MNKYPVKLGKRAVRNVEKDAVEVIGPASRGNQFVSFRYSYTEISALGGRAYVKSTRARLEEGRLTSEAFEGDLDRSVYDQMVGDAQHYFLGQTALFMKSLSLLLPFSWKQRPDRD
jgi:hypothetical protein